MNILCESAILCIMYLTFAKCPGWLHLKQGLLFFGALGGSTTSFESSSGFIFTAFGSSISLLAFYKYKNRIRTLYRYIVRGHRPQTLS